MKYSVTYLPEDEYILIKVTGRINFQAAEQYSKDAIKLAQENLCNKFLIDHTETTLKEGVYRLHTSGEELQEFGFTDKDRIAIIIANTKKKSDIPDASNQNSRFCVVKYFTEKDLSEALNWLQTNEN